MSLSPGMSRAEGLQLLLRQVEEFLCLPQITGLQAEPEPTGPLFGSSMSEGVWDHITLGFFLQPIVADGAGGAEAFFDVTCLQDLFHPLSVVCPDSGQVVCL